MPFISGMFQSDRIRSGFSDSAFSRQSRPFSASTMSWPP